LTICDEPSLPKELSKDKGQRELDHYLSVGSKPDLKKNGVICRFNVSAALPLQNMKSRQSVS
jgi:hypothetical protein